MTAKTVRVASVFAAVALTSVGAAQIGNFPWPPDVQQVGGESPVLTPEQSMRTFFDAARIPGRTRCGGAARPGSDRHGFRR